MPKLKIKVQKRLTGFNLISVSCWAGGAVAMLLLNFLENGVADGAARYGC